MGQLIKTLHNLPQEEGLVTELNGPIYGDEDIIHFHYKQIRFEMSLTDYLAILSGLIVAEKSLEELKK